MIDLALIGMGIGEVAILGSLVYSSINLSTEQSKNIRTQEGEFKKLKNSANQRKYSLIIHGDTNSVYECPADQGIYDFNTLKLVMNYFREKGFKRDDMIILDGHDSKNAPRIDGAIPSTRKNLKESLEQIASKVTPDDIFFLYCLSHGSKETGFSGESSICLCSGTVYETELKEMWKGINTDQTIAYFNQCYSGGFAKAIGAERTVAISTSRGNKFTIVGCNRELEEKYGKILDPFTLYFFSALRDKMPDGEELSLGNISLEEAFDFASKKQYEGLGRFSHFFRNIPHMVYGEIDPKEIRSLS